MNEVARSPAVRTARRGGGAPTRCVMERIAVRDSSLRQLRALILGAQLAQLRERRRMSRHSLADRIGVTPAYISRIERGNVRNLDEVRAYVAALNGTMAVVPDGPGYAVMVT